MIQTVNFKRDIRRLGPIVQALTLGLCGVVVVFVCLFLMIAPVAAETAQAHYCFSSSEEPLARYTRYSRDPSASTSLAEILAQDVSLQRVEVDEINFGSTNDEFWFQLPLLNCTAESQDLLLVFDFVRAANLEIFLESAEGVEPLFDSDLLGATVDNVAYYKKLSFPYKLQPGEEKTFYIRLIGANMTYVPISIKEVSAQGFELIAEQSKLVAVAACIFTMIAFNALLFIFTHIRVLLYYAFVELASLFFFIHNLGWTTLYIWGDGPWDQLASGVLASIGPTMMLVFSREYFDTQRHSPKTDRILKLLIYAGLAFVAFKSLTYYLPYWPASSVNAWGYACAFLTLLVSIYTATRFTFFMDSVKKLERYTNLLILVSWLILAGNILVMGLRTLNVLSFNENSILYFGLMLLIETFAVAFALALRVKITYQQREQGLVDLSRLQEEQLEQVRRERILLQDNAVANQSALEAGKLILALGHDGRQMLAALHNYADILVGSFKEGKVATIGSAIKNVTQTLSDIFGNALSIGDRSIACKQAEISHFPLTRLFEPLKLIYSAGAWEKGVALKFRDSGLEFNSDRVILMRILGNLINNAITHTDEGTVLVACRKRGDSIAIQVWDSGRGMAPEVLQSLFEGEVKLAPGASPHDEKNLGIGLKASSQMAALLGARLSARSQVGRGSMLEILLPQQVDEEVQGNKAKLDIAPQIIQ